jgi:REP element-mobilizing transposase RayT
MADPYITSLAAWPLAYLITIRTYGTWLHGDERGSVNVEHNAFGAPLLAPNDAFQRKAASLMDERPFVLGERQREVVQTTIEGTARLRFWQIHALSVRTNHVHVVVSAEQPPEPFMNSLKSWCTRRLCEAELIPKGKRVWARHGSTKYLWKMEHVNAACQYVVEGQGPELGGRERAQER